MNTPPLNDAQKQALMNEASKRLGATTEELKAAIERKDVDGLKNRLSPENAARLNALLSDENAMQTLLRHPKLQELLNTWDKKG